MHICPKIRLQGFQIYKFVRDLIRIDMLVITFAGFIIVAQHANFIDDVDQSVLGMDAGFRVPVSALARLRFPGKRGRSQPVVP